MIRVGRVSVYNARLRFLSHSCIFYKPFDLSHTNSNKKISNEPFSLDNLMKSQGENNSLLNVKEPSINRFASMFDKANELKDIKTSNKRLTSQKHNKYKNHRHKKHDNAKPIRKAVRFQFETGSDQAQSAIKSTIVKVHELSKNYYVKFVNPQTNKLENKHLVEIVNNLDLTTDGLYVVPPQKEGGLPLVKVNKVFEMIKNYTDELAYKKEQELLERGSIAAQKAVRQRDKAEKKKSATKVITLAWSISLSDLNNQKKMEIKKRLDKGEKFILYVGDKRSLYSARKSVDKEGGIIETMKDSSEEKEELPTFRFKDSDELDIELRRRQMIFEQLQTILEEFECQSEVTGEIESRLMVSCSPSQKYLLAMDSEKETEVDFSSKELKRQKKLMKQKEKEEKKKHMKVDEEDLDSLYSFKIED